MYLNQQISAYNAAVPQLVSWAAAAAPLIQQAKTAVANIDGDVYNPTASQPSLPSVCTTLNSTFTQLTTLGSPPPLFASPDYAAALPLPTTWSQSCNAQVVGPGRYDNVTTLQLAMGSLDNAYIPLSDATPALITAWNPNP